MRTFSERQVRGKAAAMLAVCDREGRVRITGNDGQSYILERMKRSDERSQKASVISAPVAAACGEIKSGKLRPATSHKIMRKIKV